MIGDARTKEIYAFSKSILNKNEVWLSTIKGLYLFDDNTNNITKVSSKYKTLSIFDDEEIFTVLEETNGILWLATARNGLYSYNLKSAKIKNYKHKLYDNSSISNNIVHNLTLDNKKNLWVATHEGLNFLKRDTDKFVSIPSFLNRKYDEKLIGALKEINDAQIKYLDTIYVSLPDSIAESKYGKQLKSLIEERRNLENN